MSDNSEVPQVTQVSLASEMYADDDKPIAFVSKKKNSVQEQARAEARQLIGDGLVIDVENLENSKRSRASILYKVMSQSGRDGPQETYPATFMNVSRGACPIQPRVRCLGLLFGGSLSARVEAIYPARAGQANKNSTLVLSICATAENVISCLTSDICKRFDIRANRGLVWGSPVERIDNFAPTSAAVDLNAKATIRGMPERNFRLYLDVATEVKNIQMKNRGADGVVETKEIEIDKRPRLFRMVPAIDTSGPIWSTPAEDTTYEKVDSFSALRVGHMISFVMAPTYVGTKSNDNGFGYSGKVHFSLVSATILNHSEDADELESSFAKDLDNYIPTFSVATVRGRKPFQPVVVDDVEEEVKEVKEERKEIVLDEDGEIVELAVPSLKRSVNDLTVEPEVRERSESVFGKHDWEWVNEMAHDDNLFMERFFEYIFNTDLFYTLPPLPTFEPFSFHPIPYIESEVAAQADAGRQLNAKRIKTESSLSLKKR
jgi:hypothetical protein